MRILRLACVLAVGLVGLSACTSLQQYRKDLTLCSSADLDRDCANHALQRYQPAAGKQAGYLLGFVELDDQGQLFRRDQLDAVITTISNEATSNGGRDILNVVFVHGWKHSAAPGDTNIATFRDALARLAAAEQAVSEATGVAARSVVGVYIGWRGLSVKPPLLKQLSFWDRKGTAHEVGHGDVTEVLNRLDLIRLVKDSQAEGGRSDSRLVVIGHSFGGAVVYSALAQELVGRFVRTVGPVGVTSNAEGFGNLVVLINPAFEAQRYASIHDISTERRRYFPGQLPVLAVLTSEADDATRLAFPAGRWFSTLLEKERKVWRRNPVTDQDEAVSQKSSNVTAVGHFAPYQTHELRATGTEAAALARTQEQTAQSMLQVSERWDQDEPGSEISFPGSVLTRTKNSAGRNPYLVIRVDRELIADHNDLSDPRVADFITHLILVASQSDDLEKRASSRRRGLTPK